MKKIYLGTYDVSQEKMTELIKTAMDAGYFGIDTAKIYQTEKAIGNSIKELKEEGYDIKVQTKIWTTDFDDVEAAFQSQLEDLQLKKVYSLLLHRPSLDFNRTVKAWKVLIDLKARGLVEVIGVSNFDKDMIEFLEEQTGVLPAINQIEMSITSFREDRLVANKALGIEIQGWSPMGINIKKTLSLPSVTKMAKEHDVKPAVIVVSYLSTQNIVPVVASSNPVNIKANTKLIKLSKEEINILKQENIYANKFEETFPH